MTITELTLKSKDAEPARRLEVFTGSGRRRDWSAADKARIVAESCDGDTTISAVARRHALSPQQLFSWRRSAGISTARPLPSRPSFVPALVTPPDPPVAASASNPRGAGDWSDGMIEVEIGGSVMRICRGADAKTIVAVLGALKDLS